MLVEEDRLPILKTNNYYKRVSKKDALAVGVKAVESKTDPDCGYKHVDTIGENLIVTFLLVHIVS